MAVVKTRLGLVAGQVLGEAMVRGVFIQAVSQRRLAGTGGEGPKA